MSEWEGAVGKAGEHNARTHFTVPPILEQALPTPSIEHASLPGAARLTPRRRSPRTIFPGIIQLARSPDAATCSAPRMVRLTCLPRIMANESELEKMEAPGMVVTVSLPALIMSASTAARLGYGPIPKRPFSL